MIINKIKVLLLFICIILFINNINAVPCDTTSYKYYIQLRSNSTRRFLQSSDLGNGTPYKWQTNNTLNTVQVANDRHGFFFFDLNSTGILSNDYYQISIDVSSYQGLSNNSLITLKTVGGGYLKENADYTVSNSSAVATYWNIAFLNVPTRYAMGIEPFLYNQVKIYSSSGKQLDVSGTTSYKVNFNGSNKIIGFNSNATSSSDFNTTFTLIPVKLGKVVIKDSYGNYLSSDPTDRRGFTIQHLGEWEMHDLVYVSDNQFKILSNYGWFYESSNNKLSLSTNSSLATVFYFALTRICLETPTETPTITETPTPTPTTNQIYISDILYGEPNYERYTSSYGYFSERPWLLNITIGSEYNQKAIYNISIDSSYFSGILPSGFIGYQDVRIYNISTGELLYYGPNMSYYSSSSSSSYETSTPTPLEQIYISSMLIGYSGYGGYVSSYGSFGRQPWLLNITIGSEYNQKAIYNISIDSNYFSGILPSGFYGYQDVRIYNISTGQLLYYGQQMAYYYYSSESSSETPSPTEVPIYIQNTLYGSYDYDYYVSSYGYFGQQPWLLNITVGPEYNQKQVTLYSIDSNYFSGSLPRGFIGYQDVRIYNISTGQLLYYAQNASYYYGPSGSESSSSNPTTTPTTTPTPTQSPIPTTCTNYNGSLIIQSNELIECEGSGYTYCEDSNESSCSTDSYNSDIKCTTKTNYMKCNGEHLICKSGYLTCSYIVKVSNSILIQDSSSSKY